MNNYVQQGHRIPITFPYGVSAGGGVKNGNVFGISVNTQVTSDNGEIQVTGVFDIVKDTSTFTDGDYVYWDDSAKKATSVTSSNIQIGVANLVLAGGGAAIGALTGHATVRTRLSAAFLSGLQIGTIVAGTNGQLLVGQTGNPAAFETVSGVITMSAAGVTALSTNLGKGTIQVPISNALIISSNDIATAANVAHTTDPILERVNAATDKTLRLSWASASVLEVQLPPVCYPPDLDDTANVVVHIIAVMKAASVNTPVIAVGAFQNGDAANIGGNTAALSTTRQNLTVTLTGANVAAYPKTLSLTLIPGAHATASNDVYVEGVWVEYTRKA